MLKQIKMPIDTVIAVTYRCNSRCKMCGIWRIKDFPEIDAKEYLKLPSSLRDVNISGGEPFLRSDLVEIMRNVKARCPMAKIIISTNGFLIEVIKRQLPLILDVAPKVELSVSVDGFGKKHEEIRGIDGGWLKVLETLIFAKALLGHKRVKIAFTLTGDNYKDVNKLYEFSKNFGVGFTLAVAQSSEFYFGGVKNRLPTNRQKLIDALVALNKKFVQGLNPKNWARAFFIDGIVKLIQDGRAPLPSYSGQDFFYLDPKGDIYPSVMDNVVMGNIGKIKDFKQFWFSDEAQAARDKLKGFEANYWMICTARTAIKRHWQTVAQWVIKKKLKIA